MIVYELVCGEGHRFEGWFACADEFSRQSAAGLLACPFCNDRTVSIVPTAKVAVRRHGAAGSEHDGSTESPATRTDVAAGLSPEVLRRLREVVLATENVGSRFPEEARRIHYAEVPARPIRGQASASEAEALRDEGIEFAALPAFLTRESH
jgi:hypothetical protein